TFDPAEIDRLRRKKNDQQPGRLEVPVASAITEVLDGSVAYRGHAIADLVPVGFESVAELLWTGELNQAPIWKTDDRLADAVGAAIAALGPNATPSDRMMAGVVAAAAADPFRADRSAHGVTASARVLIRTIVDALPGRAKPTGTRIADRLWSRLTTADPAGADQLDLALVLLADHGMATSTLAARLAASTRAAPHAVLLAGLGAVSGPLHGAASGVVHDLFAHAEADGPDAAIAAVIERDGKVPGFGHFIHRTTDPRHDLLMDALADAGLPDERLDVVAAVVGRTADRIAVAPNVDLALGALTYGAGMDRSAGEVIFAIARTAGWMAHALEEYDEAPIRFRPVGRYEPRRSSS
ncbi:MAG: citrate/2-methylcitrate synthase, partial [Actinomycetota bacterium]